MRFESVRAFALSLPEVTEEPHHHFGSFRVRGRIFVTCPPAGDRIHVFVAEEQRERALVLYPSFVEKLFWGGKVVGVRVALAGAEPRAVKALIRSAWERKAPVAVRQPPKAPKPPRAGRPAAGAELGPAGYSGTPLAKKLGYKAGSRVAAVDAPKGYRDWLQPLPQGVVFERAAGGGTDLVHVFVTRRGSLARQLAALREKLKPEASIWVSWPKKASRVPTDITEDAIRELALPLGFVDVKVCAVTEVWSGLELVVRKALRR